MILVGSPSAAWALVEGDNNFAFRPPTIAVPRKHRSPLHSIPCRQWDAK